MNSTPGPWIEVKRNECYIDIAGGLRDARGLPTAKPGDIAYVRICRVHRNGMGEAHANMIKALPDLYEALCDMVSDRECLNQKTVDFAKRALAKARGEL